MGNGHTQKIVEAEKNKSVSASAQPEPLTLKKYNKIGVIGRGGFGKVIIHLNRYGK
jgi:hypothetical protein